MKQHDDHSAVSSHEGVEAVPTSGEEVLRLEHPAAERRGFSKTKLVIWSALGLLVVCALVVGGVFWTLLNSSISSEQIRAQVEAQLTSVLGEDHSALVGTTNIAIGHGGLLSIDASDVKILQGTSTSLGVAREVGLKIKPIPLITGDVIAESITMRGATVAVDSLLSGEPDDELRPVWPLAFNMKELLAAIGGQAAILARQVESAGLESLNLEQANLVGFDQLGLRSKTASIETLSIAATQGNRDQAGLQIEGVLKTEFGDWSINGGWSDAADGGSALRLNMSGLDVQDLFGDAGAPSGATQIANRLDFSFVANYAADGQPRPAQIAVTVGPGAIPVGDKGHQAQLQEAVLRFQLDPLSNQLNLEPSSLTFENTDAQISGALRYPSSLQDTISLQPVFQFKVTEFDAFGLVERANAPKGSLLLEGFIDPLKQLVVADRIEVATPSATMQGEASIRMDQAKPHVAFSMSVGTLPVEEFKQFWPVILAPKVRNWVSENMTGGQMTDAWVKANFPPGLLGQDVLYTPDNLSARISVKSARLKNPGELPSIENAAGVVDVLGNHTNITISGGEATIAGAGKLKLGKSTMKMGNYAIPLTPARLDINMSGPASAMVKLATLEPLGFSNRLDVRADQISGSASADVAAHFMIGKTLSLAKKPWSLKLNARNVGSKKPINGRKLTQANMTIVASPKEAKITGTAKLDNVPVKLAVVESLDGSGSQSSQITMTLSDKDRAKIGLDTGSVITGPIEASIEDLSNGTQRIEANLKNAKLNFPWIGWTKGKGIPARASFVMSEKNGLTRFTDFKLRGNGFGANGSFSIDKSGLRDADLTNIVLNDIDDFDVKAKRGKAGYDIRLNARTYDGRAMIRSLLSAEIKPSQSKAAGLFVKGKIRRLIGFGGQSLTDVNIDFQQRGKVVSRVAISARAASNAPTRFTMGPAPSGTELEIATTNAGSVLRFLDLYSKIRGGSISATLTRDQSQTFRGRIVAKNFDMLNEPRLAQLLQKPRISSDISRENQVIKSIENIQTDRARIDELHATIEKGNGFLNISRGRLWGGDAGAAFDGVVYDRNNRMNVKGTFLPGRGLNRLASKIPILGLAFGKGKVNGLLGITFQLYGRFDNPSLRVNPLSLIAPGVFRQIFKF